jgi:N-acetylglucosamine-6-phosphate deacetylase
MIRAGPKAGRPSERRAIHVHLCALYGAALYTPDGATAPGWLLAENGRIAALGRGPAPDSDAERVDLAGRHLLPGLIDLHIHGALGRDTMEATPEALTTVAAYCARHGTTSFLATTMAAPAGAIAAAREQRGRPSRATPRRRGTAGRPPGGPLLGRGAPRRPGTGCRARRRPGRVRGLVGFGDRAAVDGGPRIRPQPDPHRGRRRARRGRIVGGTAGPAMPRPAGRWPVAPAR